MIKVKYGHYKGVTGSTFLQAVHKLLGTVTDGHTSYRLAKVLTPFKKGADEVYQAYQKDIIEKFVKRDEKGEYNKEMPELPNDGENADFDKAVEAFGEREIKVDRPRLTAHDVRDAKLTPNEIEALELVIDEKSFENEPKPTGKHTMKLA